MAVTIDFGIIRPELGNALAAGYRASEQERMQRQADAEQRQLSKLQLEKAQFDLDRLHEDRRIMLGFQDRLRSLGKDTNLETYFRTMVESGNPDLVDKGVTGLRKLQEQQMLARVMGYDADNGAATPTAPANALVPSAAAPEQAPTNALTAPAPAAAPAPAPATASVPAPADQNAALRRRIDVLIATGTPQSLQAAQILQSRLTTTEKPPTYHAVNGALVNPATGAVVYEGKPQPTGEQREYELAVRQGFKGSFLDYKRAVAAAGRTPPTPPTPAAPVAVVKDGKTVYVSREEAIRDGLTPASAMEGLPPKEVQKREAAFPQATSAVKGYEAKSESLIKDMKALRDHPGLDEITGIAAGRLPAFTAKGREAQALYDKIVAKGGFQALQDLRDASKTGGALGNVSNQEGRQLTSSFAAIDRRQDAKSVRAALDQAISDVEGSRMRVREAYDDTYSYKQGRAPAPAPAPAKPAPTPGKPAAAKPSVSNW